jgi:hypothetical protein
MNEIEIILYCDFHGHSRKQNVFIYGCENKHLPNERFKERIFPAMLAKNDPTKVCYDFKKMLIHSKSFFYSFRIIRVNLKFKNIKKELEELLCGHWEFEIVLH